MPARQHDHKIEEQVGKNIRHRRKLIEMTQMQLANKIGVTFQQVQKYECGAACVSPTRLVAIARAMECTVASFFCGIM